MLRNLLLGQNIVILFFGNKPITTEYPGILLSLKTLDGAYLVDTRFWHDNTIHFQISFFDDENWDKSRTHYVIPTELEPKVLEYSVSAPVGEMRSIESRLISHYLDRFMRDAHRQQSAKS